MIRSMTGYSRARREEEGFSLAVSLKSTNHRSLDLQVRIPQLLEPLEMLVRRQVKEALARGHVEVAVTFEQTAARPLQFDRQRLRAYVAACQEMRQEFGFTAEPDLVGLFRSPGVVSAANGELSGEDLERLRAVLERVVGESLGKLNEMRGREGEALGRDVSARLKRLEELSDRIQKLERDIPRLHRRRLEGRVKELLEGVELDAARLAQEVAYLAARSDIAEELARLRSHLDQATRLVEQPGEVGKKLDFLLQEMNREANTLLSKTTDVPEIGVEIGRCAIEMKTEIEKLREQAQNIE